MKRRVQELRILSICKNFIRNFEKPQHASLLYQYERTCLRIRVPITFIANAILIEIEILSSLLSTAQSLGTFFYF